MSSVHVIDWAEVAELVEAKDGRTVSVVLPALNEEATVGDVVASIRPLLGGLVDELVVMDSGSTDATAARATAAGARVVTREEAVPSVPPKPGKGEVLWRSVAATTGDLIVFVDSDLIDPDPMFVPRLVGPLLRDRGVSLVKAYYRRPLRIGENRDEGGGGRVTELVARPLLSSLKPELSTIIQPLGGEYGGTRELLSSVPFAPGYGVEIGLLIDAYDRCGIDAIAQVNLGVRKHRNRKLTELGVMSRQIVGVLLGRCGVVDSRAALTQFVEIDDDDAGRPRAVPQFVRSDTEVDLTDRPPMASVMPSAAGRPRPQPAHVTR
ncbi:glucosyl-3-phosphoglycerate synthase [Gordonia sp. TBRC 11910]|uniref:Glucosyl-3-phosphoglycerate synthase n=1 Tax=Gordonia asplenii TaxID=2725283 RepID=A0A848KYX0_9ACTN|nr:glucosyl-3-phosphoglycerate synthase [Gordonia asplenii]NMO02045.1 glucosyl-3-phosphoglycerate synthase [Gordonia asplenii]